MAEDAELVGVGLDRLDRLDVDRLAQDDGGCSTAASTPASFISASASSTS